MSIAGNVRTVNTYDIHRNSGLDLRALLVGALTERLPVALTRDDEAGTVSGHIGVPITVTHERLSLRTPDGGLFRCPLWEIDRCTLIAETEQAA
jgi:hypothetical protein